jgi:hypothetical protein
MSKQMHGTGICDCCDGRRKLTPASLENQPGLDQIAYRVGTHGSFKATMLTSLAEQSRLRKLTTRQDDDPSIALIDGWASVLDVLSFYQERIANEGFLSTATERRSVLELARSIGYELRGGVAANTYLTFTVELPRQSTPETNLQLQSQIPDPVIVEKGTKVQSIPGLDELPQIFETSERLEARSCWQDMQILPPDLYSVAYNDLFVLIKGNDSNIKPGDHLLLKKDDDCKIRKVIDTVSVSSSLLKDTGNEYNRIKLDQNAGFSGNNVDVYLLQLKAKLFGYNAPDAKAMPAEIKTHFNITNNEWQNMTLSNKTIIDLDLCYKQINMGQQVVVVSPGQNPICATISKVEEKTVADFTITSLVTTITLNKALTSVSRREVTVFADPKKLDLAKYNVETNNSISNKLRLAKPIYILNPGRLVSIVGTESGTGKTVGEVSVISNVEEEGDTLIITFQKNLIYNYLPHSVSVNANVVPATHGESKVEVLGGGDASQPFQRVMLKQSPLTFVPASTPSGSMTTLSVRVNDILWEEVQSLYQQPPDKKCYITRMSDDGQVTVQFGDGINGARVPPGNENIKAEYRTGIGLEGQVKAGQLSMLLTRTNGLKDVINPTAPTGAEDPEKLDQARKNAPMTVMTLDRIVSPQDYEDFALAFAGIAKAKVALLTSGEQTFVHLTVAAPQAKIIPTDSATLRQLKEAIDQARYPRHRVVIDSITESSIKKFKFSARLLVDSAYIAEKVEFEVRNLLLKVFSFESRQFGQSVSESEIVGVAQKVKGVIAVLDVKLSIENTDQNLIVANMAKINSQAEITPAELCLIDPSNLTLTKERA